MKQKIKLLDNSFSHSILGYCSDFQTSDDFEWDRSLVIKEQEIIVVTDNFLSHNTPNKRKLAWLLEPVCISPHNYEFIKKNLNKFEYVLTHEKTILELGKNVNFIPFGCSWIPKENQNIYDKSKNISIIASNKSMTDGHKLRHEIIQNYYEKIDVMGRGYKPIDYKIQGLKDYRFSIVIENCKRDYWFTEKLIDCFMTGTIPIYWGCPSINNFFDTNGMLLFDNFNDLYNIIENCDEDLYGSKIESIKNNFEIAKKYILPDQHVFDFIKKI